jgi:hypothetical protein
MFPDGPMQNCQRPPRLCGTPSNQFAQQKHFARKVWPAALPWPRALYFRRPIIVWVGVPVKMKGFAHLAACGLCRPKRSSDASRQGDRRHWTRRT